MLALDALTIARLPNAHRASPSSRLSAIGASDGRYFADDGIEIVNFGPGGGSEGHAANEFVLASELETSAAIHLALVERLLGLRG